MKELHIKHEVYRSPLSVYKPLIDRLPEYFENKSILDPSAGDGRMLKYIIEKYPKSQEFHWHFLFDIREEEISLFESNSFWLSKNVSFFNEDFLLKDSKSWFYEGRNTHLGPHTMITNPPFSLAIPFIEKGLTLCNDVFILQRVNWLGTQKRSEWLSKASLKTIYIIPKRPVWEIDNRPENGADTYEYMWAHFQNNYKNKPQIEWLI